MDQADLAQSACLVPGGEAGDDPALASRWVQSFLALDPDIGQGGQRSIANYATSSGR